MKTWFYFLAIALGFTTLYCDSLLSFSGWVAFHWSGSSSSLFLAGLFDFVCLWLLFAALLYRLRRPGRLRNLLWAAMLLFMPALLIEKRLLTDSIVISASRHRTIDLACLLLWLVAATILYKVFARFAERLMLVYVFWAASGIVLLTHALWFGWRSRDLNPPFHDKVVQTALPSAHPRVVWIVMDELPYQFLFERRPTGLDLPAFDALTRTATVFTAATPPSIVTEYAMPAYLTAITPFSLSQGLDGSFTLHTADPGSNIPFNQHDTVFQDARNAGYTTAAAGWFLPYCRILPDLLDRCEWTYREPLGNGMSARSGLFGNIAAPFLFAAPHLLPSAVRTLLHIPINRQRRVSYHIEDYNQLHQASERLLRDRSLGFVLLHLPVPHNPDIYDRRSGTVRYVPANSFVDNLALADRCFAELRAVLEETHQWDDTTILLMGDHGWRGEASEGIHDAAAPRDQRQAYVVKLAGQHDAQTVDTPYGAIRTRSLLRAIMQQTVRTPADLQRWAQDKQ